MLYALLPQHWLGGTATRHGELLALREDLLPVACYFFGRGLALESRELQRIGAAIVATACGVALFGIVDAYAIPLSWWRTSSRAPGWFSKQLGLSYGPGLSGLPENFVYNTGNGHVFRRLVSTFLSPLASSYMFVAALLLASVWRLRRRAADAAVAARQRAARRRARADATRARRSSRSRSASGSSPGCRPPGGCRSPSPSA